MAIKVQMIKERRSLTKNRSMMIRTRFEELKFCQYVANILTSGFVCSNAYEISRFAAYIIGEKTVFSGLKDYRKDAAVDREEDYDNEDYYWVKKISPNKVFRHLKIKVLPIILKRIKQLGAGRDNEFHLRLLKLKETFGLSDIEIEVLFFYYLQDTSAIFNSFMENSTLDSSSFVRFKNFGHCIIGYSSKEISTALSKGTLIKNGILTVTEIVRAVEINAWCMDYLSGIAKKELKHKFYTTENDIKLLPADFNLSEDETLVIGDLLKGAGKCNILLYGRPGTGKTSIAKALVKEYGKSLISVNVPDDDSQNERILGIHAALNFADNQKSIILVDEADELLNSGSYFFKKDISKSRINDLLDSHKHKIVWITNDTDEIHPSTMRRFSFSLEFKKLGSKDRIKVLRYELRKKKLDGIFKDDELKEICETYAVDAGGIVNAISQVGIRKKQNLTDMLKKIKAILSSHEKLIIGKSAANKAKKTFRNYTIEGLNTSQDLNRIISIIEQYEEHRKKSTEAKSLALLLYGFPGTGKSEFVHYLGHVLDKKVHLKRASDILAKYIGETEQNIAEAFYESGKNESILFFDEADTFLYPRSSAQHSWEKSFTNEFLAQLDAFSGIALFATNDIDGLDHAALRRFKFKIEFKPLTPEGNLHFYKTLIMPLLSDEMKMSSEQISNITNIHNLTPGDFIAARDQFEFMNKAEITHELLIDALSAEVKHKKGEKVMIGFGGR